MTHDQTIREIGKRATSRLRVSLMAQVVTTRITLTAQLRDLSCLGAQIACVHPPVLSCEVMIRWVGHEAFGVVVWANISTFGIRFFDAIEQEVLIATRNMEDAKSILTRNDQSRCEAKPLVKRLFQL